MPLRWVVTIQDNSERLILNGYCLEILAIMPFHTILFEAINFHMKAIAKVFNSKLK